MSIIVLILKFTGEGEIFFFQYRVGRSNKKIKLIKFVTMLKNSENMGTGTITVHNDPRILPFGNFLRKTKLNELPQLLNVFLGDMSVIGPRPQTQRCFDAFPESSRNAILKVRPGLSGIGSIVFRSEEDMMNSYDNPDYLYDNVIMPFKGKLEEWYVKNNSLTTYFKLIFITVLVILAPKLNLIWALFPNLPKPPEKLENWIKI
tara:strand:+ start:616 stop:1227 length:612 start_codon:yes stop_codon:yes gene_type:complete